MKKLLPIVAGLLAACSSHAQVLHLAKDFFPGNSAGHPHRLAVFKNKLTFIASQSAASNGYELWSLDSVGTFKEQTTFPGPGDGGFIPIPYMYERNVVLNGKLYFPGDDGTTGGELYSWDGVNTPTVAFDLVPGSNSSLPAEFITLNNKLYFSATTPATGMELFVYDPATGTATLAADVYPGTTDGYPRHFVVFNNKIYFQARNATAGTELFCYDQATSSFYLVSDIEPATIATSGSQPANFMVVSNKLYFEGSTTAHGRELYSMNTTESITRLTDINSGSKTSLIGYQRERMGLLNGNLYFAVLDSQNAGVHLYRYNTNTNTVAHVMRMNSYVSHMNQHSFEFINYANKLFFAADDSLRGMELWKVDASNVVSLAADINIGIAGSYPNSMAVYGNALFVPAEDDSVGMELFVYVDSMFLPNSIAKIAGSISGLRMYPNPAAEEMMLEFTLQKEQLASITVSDMSGRVVQEVPAALYNQGKTAIALDISKLAAGVYYCTVSSGEGNGRVRFLKQ
jgi:ELWxxDGT repeat protein